MSVISQLSSQGIAPRVFSHCLKGDNSGGGVLVLGEIVEPNIVYTPLVPSQYVYLLEYMLHFKISLCQFLFVVQSCAVYILLNGFSEISTWYLSFRLSV